MAFLLTCLFALGVLFFFFVPSLVCACVASHIASTKGRAGLGFLLGFFFLPFGILIACLLPETPRYSVGTRTAPSPVSQFERDAKNARRWVAYRRRREIRRARRKQLAAAIGSIPERWDDLLRRAAGVENELIYRFFWLLTLGSLFAACGAAAWAIIAIAPAPDSSVELLPIASSGCPTRSVDPYKADVLPDGRPSLESFFSCADKEKWSPDEISTRMMRDYPEAVEHMQHGLAEMGRKKYDPEGNLAHLSDAEFLAKLRALLLEQKCQSSSVSRTPPPSPRSAP